ncbi:unnamed protein product, partial [marine sediment metagenome]
YNVALGAVVEIPIAAENDDVEQQTDGMYFDSSDLELIYDNDVTNPDDLQVVGIRFVDVGIPSGATIVSASVRFVADDVDDDEHIGDAYVIIEGELSPNAGAFEDTADNVSARARTAAQAAWGPVHWSEKGANYETSGIADIIQEIVNQDDWAAGNALVLIFSQDPDNPSTGVAEAEAGVGDDSALLHVEFDNFRAYQPVPADGAVDVAIDVNESTLEWTAGDTAVTHKVYLSTDETIDESDLVGETKLTSIAVDLALGTTYYWRVDEV